jgi:hypothetical protein
MVFIAGGFFSRIFLYSETDRHVSFSPRRAAQSDESLASPYLGDAEPPHCPFISVVIPCFIFDGASGSNMRYASLCACESMNPGDTMFF